jgi:hypothetical protein
MKLGFGKSEEKEEVGGGEQVVDWSYELKSDEYLPTVCGDLVF